MLISLPEKYDENKDYGSYVSYTNDGWINDWIRVKFYTADHVYSISVHWKGEMENSYLGCVASTRKNRPGEFWNRGNDLPDGKYNDKTWMSILIGILRYEMKNLKI